MDGNAAQPIDADRSQADLRREEIVNRAAELFERDGYFGTTLDDLGASIGLKKATLYHYFSSKDEILRQLHEELIGWTYPREVARQRYQLAPDHHLLEVIADTLEIIAARPGHIQVFIEHFRELPPDVQRQIAEKRDAYTAMIEDVFREGVESGAFRELDPAVAVLGFFGAINWAYRWLEVDNPDETRELAYSIWDILMNGIAADRDAPLERYAVPDLPLASQA
jgi:TetR/AcrR family transcriptional regulator, cholesterol catabolism regulator